MICFNTYDVGDIVRSRATFTDQLTGELMDPHTVHLTVRKPSGDMTSYTYEDDIELVRDAEGRYHLDIDIDMPGIWFSRWWSTGIGQAATERRFQVRPVKAIA